MVVSLHAKDGVLGRCAHHRLEQQAFAVVRYPGVLVPVCPVERYVQILLGYRTIRFVRIIDRETLALPEIKRSRMGVVHPGSLGVLCVYV